MRQVVAYKSLKTAENYKIVSTKSGHGLLRKVTVYEKLRLKDFDWENFGVLDWWSSLTRDGRTWRSIHGTLSPVLLQKESSLYRRKVRHFMLFCVLAVHTIKDRCQWLSIQHSVNITSVCIYAVMFQICL